MNQTLKVLFLIIISFILVLNGCSSDQNSADSIASLYSNRGINFDKEIEYCIVLPEVGCSGCIAGGVKFIKNNREKFSKSQKRYLIVFTAINSKKLLHRTMGFDLENELNCIVDSLDYYKLKSNMKFYPMLIKLNNGQISNVAFQHPKAEYDIFHELSKDW